MQLIKIFLFGNQSYWAQIFILPAKVMKTIEASCKSYMWSGTNEITRKALVALIKLGLPKSARGLNVINMTLSNKAVIANNCWDLARKKDTFLIR